MVLAALSRKVGKPIRLRATSVASLAARNADDTLCFSWSVIVSLGYLTVVFELDGSAIVSISVMRKWLSEVREFDCLLEMVSRRDHIPRPFAAMIKSRSNICT